MIESTASARGRRGLSHTGVPALGLLSLTALGLLGGTTQAQQRSGPATRTESVDWGALERGVSSIRVDEVRPSGPARNTTPRPGDLVVDDETGVEFLWQDPATDGAPEEEFGADGDYSPQALFARLHGDFMRNAFFYRPNLRLGYRFQSARDTETNFQTATFTTPPAGNDRGDFDINQFEADWNYNYAIAPDVFLITGFTFGADAYDFNGAAPQLSDETLYEVSAKIGAGWFVSDDVLIQGYYAPGYYSDLDGGLNSNDVQNFGRILSTVKLSDTFYAHGGVEVSAVFEDVPVYPLLGLTAILSEEWRIDILAPVEAAVRWSPSPEWTFSGGLQLDGDEFSYRTRTATIGTVPPSTAPSTQQDINIQEFRLFVEALYRMDNGLSLYGRFGSTLAADYNYRLSNVVLPVGPPETGDFDGVVEPNLLLEIGLGIDL